MHGGRGLSRHSLPQNFRGKLPAPSGTSPFQHGAARSSTEAALQGAGWVLPVTLPKGIRNASPMRNIELLTPGFALPLWMHPLLKNIIQSPKKSTGRTPKSLLLSNCLGFCSAYKYRASTSFISIRLQKLAGTGRSGPFLDLFCIIVSNNVLQVKCSTETQVTCLYSAAPSQSLQF